jgi:hypothetical protein
MKGPQFLEATIDTIFFLVSMNTSFFYHSQHQRIDGLVTPTSKDDFNLDLSFLDESESPIFKSCNPNNGGNPMDAAMIPQGKTRTPEYRDDDKLELARQLDETRRELEQVKQERDQGAAMNQHLVQELVEVRINLEYERDMHESNVQQFLAQQRAAHHQAFDQFLSHTLPQNASLFPSRLVCGPDGSIRNYMVGQILGSGAYGSVVVGSHLPTKRRVAIKILPNGTAAVHLSNEVQALMRANHPNVVKMYEYVVDDVQGKFGLVMEQGVVDLNTCMARGHVISLDVLREITLATLKAVQHLHSRGIAHLDIKPENLLIMKNLPISEIRQAHIRLCDFGLCTLAPAPGCHYISETDMKGTNHFFAPEMADFIPYNANAADIWSIGATLLDLTEEMPEEWKHSYALFHDTEDIGRHGFKTGLSRIIRLMNEEDYFCHNPGYFQVFELAKGMLKMKPSRRLTATQALQDPWLLET